MKKPKQTNSHKMQAAILKRAKEQGTMPLYLDAEDVVIEYPAIAGRRFRFDCAVPKYGILVDVQGGIWTGGAHVRGVQYLKDCEKSNLATLEGFKVFWCGASNKQIADCAELVIKAVLRHIEGKT